jgi:hypothetical protein
VKTTAKYTLFGASAIASLVGLKLLSRYHAQLGGSPNLIISDKEGEELTRGERNNNPGNLRYNKIPWKGLDNPPYDSDGFCRFTDPVFGIRAMYKDLYNDFTEDGLDTIAKLISEYAPANENKTTEYINYISRELGIEPNAIIQEDTIARMLKPMILMENGRVLYSDMIIYDGVNLA